MEAIFINAREGKIEKVKITEDNALDDIYKILSVDMIESVSYANIKRENMLYVDENGRINGTDFGFKILSNIGTYVEIMGNGIILGLKNSGWTNTSMIIPEVDNIVLL